MRTELTLTHLEHIKIAAFIVAIIGSAYSNSLCGIGLGVYLTAFILQFGFFGKKDIEPFPHFNFLLPLFFCLAISVYISDHFFVSLRGLWKYLEGFFLLYAALDVIRDRRTLRRILSVYLVVVFFSAMGAIFQDWFGYDLVTAREPIPYKVLTPFRGSGIYDIIETRVTGPFKHSNDYGTFLVPGFLLFVVSMWDAVRKRRFVKTFLCGVGLMVVAYALIRSMSIGPIISLAVGLFCFSMFFRQRWIMMVVAGLCVALYLVVPSQSSERFKSVLHLKYDHASERILLLKTAKRMVDTSPYFGLGLNTYSSHFDEFKPKDYRSAMYAHNAYVQMATEAGLVGLFFYLLFIGRVFVAFLYSTLKATGYQEYKLLLAGLVGALTAFLINCLFDSCLQSTQLRTLFWILMGLATAVTAHAFFDKTAQETRSG